jgi:hypothetical protein
MRNIRVHLLNILRQRGKQFMTQPSQHCRRFHWINVNGVFNRKKMLFDRIYHFEVDEGGGAESFYIKYDSYGNRSI